MTQMPKHTGPELLCSTCQHKGAMLKTTANALKTMNGISPMLQGASSSRGYERDLTGNWKGGKCWEEALIREHVLAQKIATMDKGVVKKQRTAHPFVGRDRKSAISDLFTLCRYPMRGVQQVVNTVGSYCLREASSVVGLDFSHDE
jgi:hypothetical protein